MISRKTTAAAQISESTPIDPASVSSNSSPSIAQALLDQEPPLPEGTSRLETFHFVLFTSSICSFVNVFVQGGMHSFREGTAQSLFFFFLPSTQHQRRKRRAMSIFFRLYYQYSMITATLVQLVLDLHPWNICAGGWDTRN